MHQPLKSPAQAAINLQGTPQLKTSKEPSEAIAASTIADKPAAGPETLIGELEILPTTKPPIIPEIIPENNGAPEAIAIPRHKGSAIKNTTKPEEKSNFRWAKILFLS